MIVCQNRCAFAHYHMCVYLCIVHDTCRILMCTKICSEMTGNILIFKIKVVSIIQFQKTIVKYFLGELKVLITKMRPSFCLANTNELSSREILI